MSIVCPECSDLGPFPDEEGDEWDCPLCEGTGEVESDEEDIHND